MIWDKSCNLLIPVSLFQKAEADLPDPMHSPVDGSHTLHVGIALSFKVMKEKHWPTQSLPHLSSLGFWCKNDT